MSECCIKFPEPVSRGTIGQLVIEYMKYILYYRGQFPLPLDQLILSIESNKKSATQAEIDEHPVYYDQVLQTFFFSYKLKTTYFESLMN